MVNDTAIVVIPPYLRELSSNGIVSKHRISRGRGSSIQNTRLARCVRGNWYLGKNIVCLWMQFLEDGGDIESVYEEGGTACSVTVLQ